MDSWFVFFFLLGYTTIDRNKQIIKRNVLTGAMPVISMMSTKVEAFQDPSNVNSFGWSCRPVLRWMRLIGIPLADVNEPGNGRKSGVLTFIVVFLALFLYVMNVLCNGTMILQQFYSAFEIQKNGTWTSTLNGYITFANYACCNLLCHTGLLFCTATRWNSLTKTLQLLERFQMFRPEDYRSFRHVCVTSLLFIIFVIRYTMVLPLNNWP